MGAKQLVFGEEARRRLKNRRGCCCHGGRYYSWP